MNAPTKNSSLRSDDVAGKTILVIGATGGIGGEVARAAHRHGFRVRALTRRPEAAARAASSAAPIEWIKGDAMNAADVVAAAEGASWIFHGANPPGTRTGRGWCCRCWRARLRRQRPPGRGSSSPAACTTSALTRSRA